MIRLLADDMGLGKTRVACHLIPKGWGCIVTAPVNVKYGWQKELNSLFPDLLTTVCKSPKDFRLPIAGEVVIANYEQINDHVVIDLLIVGDDDFSCDGQAEVFG